jgi:hypothetical protein
MQKGKYGQQVMVKTLISPEHWFGTWKSYKSTHDELDKKWNKTKFIQNTTIYFTNTPEIYYMNAYSN